MGCHGSSDNGTLAMVAGAAVERGGVARLTWFDSAGRTEAAAGQSGVFDIDTRLSPDGKFLALEAQIDGSVSIDRKSTRLNSSH